MKIVAKKDRKLLLINTGNTQNENKAETIELTVPEEYEDYNKKIVFVTDDGIVWDIIQDNTYKLTKAITKYKQVDFYIWLTKGDVDFRSKTMPLRFYHNEDASDEITPEEISGVNTVVNILEEEITKVDSLETELRALITDIQNKLDNGEFDGEDGYTPQKGIDYFTKQDIEEIEGDILNEVYTKTQTDTLLEEKADIEDIPDVSSFITKDVNNLTNYTLKTNTGSLIDLEINDTTYVVTLKLKSQDGTVISTDTIDLPLESVVVSGRYDNTTKKVILTLENGSEVDFSVADLVAGLQTEITSQNKLASDLVDDTNSGNKFVTTTEKQTWNNKLDESDLTDYVKNTDYASSSKGGTIKTENGLGTYVNANGTINASTRTYQQYLSSTNETFIGKGTLENVIAGKQLINQTQLEESQETQDEEIEKLQEENARLKATLPTTGEVTGQDVTLDKTAELEFKKPPLPMGNSEQESTNNLLYLDSVRSGYNDIEPTLVNGIVHLKGTNNEEYNVKGNYRNGFVEINTTQEWKTNTTYYISCKIEVISNVKELDTSYFNCFLYGGNSQPITKDNSTGRYIGSITTPASLTDLDLSRKYVEIRIDGMEVNISEVSLKTVEDYTFNGYGIKPSPEHESPIANVTGDVEVKVQNKNRCKSIYQTEDLRRYRRALYVDFDIKPNTQYAFSFNTNQNGLVFYPNENIFTNSGAITVSSSDRNIFIGTTKNLKDLSNTDHTSNGYAIFKNNIDLSVAATFEDVQIEQNSTSTNFVEHKEQTFTFPLGNEKLMLGDYLADDGIHHVRGQYIFTGNESISKYANSTYAFVVYTDNISIKHNSNVDRVLCNKLQHSTLSYIYDNKENSNNNIASTFAEGFAMMINNYTTTQELTNYLTQQYQNETPVIVECELEEEIIVPYTSAQQTAYNQIKQALSYEEQTNIIGSSNGSNPIFTVEGYQNTKLVLKEMATAIVALGGV